VTPTNGGQQYAQACQEMALLRRHLRPNAQEPAAYAARRAALLYNVESRWDMDNHKQNVRWDSLGHLRKAYRALKRLGCPVDVITEDKDFTRYPFLVVPAYQLADREIAGRWTDYARNGGHLVLTCRTAHKDRRGHLWEGPWAAPILDLIGAKIAFYDTLPAPVAGKVKAGRRVFEWFSWGEVLEPQEGVQVLATYADQYYAGGAAAVTRTLGRGSVTYIGVDSAQGDLELDLIRGVLGRAKVQTMSLEDGFLVDWRDGFWVATNFTEKRQTVPAPRDTRLLVGTRVLPPAGVAVWQE